MELLGKRDMRDLSSSEETCKFGFWELLANPSDDENEWKRIARWKEQKMSRHYTEELLAGGFVGTI